MGGQIAVTFPDHKYVFLFFPVLFFVGFFCHGVGKFFLDSTVSGLGWLTE